MKKYYKTIMILVLAFGLSIGYAKLTVFGQGSDTVKDSSTKINKEVKAINNDIQDKKLEIKRIQQKQDKYTNAIKQKQTEKSSLNNQLAILDNRVAKSELDLELAQIEIERIELEIKKTDQEIDDKNSLIAIEKTKIGNVLRLANKKGNTSTLEIILLNDSLAKFMNQVKYLEDINSSIKSSLDNLKDLRYQLNRDKNDLHKQNKDFAKLKNDLELKRDALEAEKESKLMIIAQLSSSEAEYQRLLAQSKREQQEAASEIATMEQQARAKLASLEGQKLEFNDNGLIWPVPKNTITAYFHDPGYPFKHIFEHPAVDIRAAQGTTLKAAASGYVARVKSDGSTNYGYIMIIHGDGLSTVYGHASKSYVKEDEYVVQGQAIGRSGGLPGAPGSGRLTTGPHLHFEVRLNGIPVDPLGYLP